MLAASIRALRRYPGTLRAAGFFCISLGGAEGLRWNTLSEIEKPDSGTEPIHQEHLTCSRFRGSCPSDVKSAVHPESDFPISLSVFTAALCVPREIQKNPAARSVPGYRRSARMEAASIATPGKNRHAV